MPKFHARDKIMNCSFLTPQSLKVSEVKKHLVFQLYTVNILFLSSTCRQSREQDFLLHQQMVNVTKLNYLNQTVDFVRMAS